MSDDDLQPDRIDGAPHPRDTERLIGQDTAEAAFLDAFNSGKLHHAWLLTGPRGVGKATLAWRLAKFLLATPDPDDGGMFSPEPAATLDINPDHPVARRMAARSEPGLKSVTRSVNPDTKRMRKQIVVDDIRALGGFFQLSAAEGGRRVVIIDTADEMNPNAANALLKMLEEPPERAVLLLISHQPSSLLPTIRSRCRILRLNTLSPAQMAEAFSALPDPVAGDPAALAALSGGSVGEALRLSLLGGLQIYSELVALMDTLPQLDRARALKLAEAAATRGAEEKLALLFTLVDLLLARLARTGSTGIPPVTEAAPNEIAMLSRLAPGPAEGRAWAEAAQEISARARHGLAVNLDPAALVLDTLQKMGQTAPR
jgi:DNA polymerase III subunit delta'